ncbi:MULTISPECIES: hypothetical protein [Altibacter]|uniref:hypothetical protein n=1 Tax=Altibacter TaxID=1535231 RepID=UPI0005599D8A|nr:MULTISPECIES: hypothetical protein [Altibacter]MCW8981788.1 hypothetical protein [Altibacter sp.]MCW9038475.1 hypothetical protein [Altibacter sp.]
MRNIALSFVLIFLCSGCYTYKTTIETSNIEVNEKYEFVLKETGKKRARLLSIGETNILLKKNGRSFSVPLSDIVEIKSRKFSYFNTIVSILSISLVTIAIIGIFTWDGPEFSISPAFPN